MYGLRDDNGLLVGASRWPCFDADGNRLCDEQPIDETNQEWLDYLATQEG